MFDRRRGITISISASLLAVTLAGIATTAQDKVGGGTEPVSLVLAVDRWAVSGHVDVFADLVDELSGGQMRIDVDPRFDPTADVMDRLRGGEADVAWLFTREAGSLGATDLEALQAPFLVTDAALFKQIISGPIGDDMLAGLADDGLVGLALLPGERRFFVGLDKTFTSLADFDGARIDLPRNALNFSLAEAMGAEPVNYQGADRPTLESEGVDAILTDASGLLDAGAAMTANIVPHTVGRVLLADPDTMASLSAEQRDILYLAARSLRDTLLAEAVDVESSASRCAVGGQVVMAPAEDVAAIVAAAQPVFDDLARDPEIAGYIERIEALKAEEPDAPFPAVCGGSGAPTATLSGWPDGTYSATATIQDAIEMAVWEGDCNLEQDERIVFAIEADQATFLVGCGDDPLEVGAHFTLEYSGDDRVTLVEPGYPESEWATLTWVFDGEVLSLQAPDHPIGKYLFEHDFTFAPAGGPEVPQAPVPEGTYAATITREDALELGFDDECLLGGATKVVTLVIEGDRFTELQACNEAAPEVGSTGTLEFVGQRMIMREPGYPGGVTFSWSTGDDGSLTLEVLEIDEDVAPLEILRGLFEHEFKRLPQ